MTQRPIGLAQALASPVMLIRCQRWTSRASLACQAPSWCSDEDRRPDRQPAVCGRCSLRGSSLSAPVRLGAGSSLGTPVGRPREIAHEPTQWSAGRHFLGAIVVQEQSPQPGRVVPHLVVDGQQRLTTLQLLLATAHSAISEMAQEGSARLLGRLVRNDEALASGDERFKVWPTDSDRGAFRLVMQADGPPSDSADDPANTIQEAYAFFSEQMRIGLAAVTSHRSRSLHAAKPYESGSASSFTSSRSPSREATTPR